MQNTLTDSIPYHTASAQIGALTEEEFNLFRDLIYRECGISLSKEKRIFLESRLKKRMFELGINNMSEYFHLVSASKNKAQELPSLFDVLTIGETSFFRNRPQFDLFTKYVLPELVAKKEKINSRLLRVWSAGCSTGQEPYSLAMSILQHLADPDSWAVRVFASDLSFTALERAQQGLYNASQVKSIEPEFLAKYFTREGENYQINDAVKRRVIFDYHNLKNDNGLRNLDVVVCRNVMIYFDFDEQKRLIERFSNCLLPGGYLFIGHAESMRGMSDRFVMLHKDKGIAYRFDE
jgi:chemotaxis protein methyltransferase CheR